MEDNQNTPNFVDYCKQPSTADSDHFQCFSRKGMHFIHLNVHSALPKISEIRYIAK